MKLFIKKYLQISRLPFFWATFQHFTTVTIGSGLALTRFQAQRKFQGRKSWLLRELNGALMLCWFLGTSVWAPSVNTAFPFFLLHLCTIFTLYYLHETKKTMSQWSILHSWYLKTIFRIFPFNDNTFIFTPQLLRLVDDFPILITCQLVNLLIL